MVYGFNIDKPYHEIYEDIRYSNIIKKLAFHIMLASYRKSKEEKKNTETDDEKCNANSSFRE